SGRAPSSSLCEHRAHCTEGADRDRWRGPLPRRGVSLVAAPRRLEGRGWLARCRRAWRRGDLMTKVSALILFAQVGSGDVKITADQWQLVQRQSGPVNYYSVIDEGGVSFLRSKYVPPTKTAVMGWQTPEADRRKIERIR